MTLDAIDWLTPEYALLALLPLLVAVRWYVRRGFSLETDSTTGQAFIHPLAHLIPSRTDSQRRDGLQHLLALWVVLCLLAAFAQPVRIGERLPDLPPERDIVLLLDTSISMLQKDYLQEGEPVSRMTMLKNLLDSFVERLQGERVSVIVFAENAYVWIPLTRDQNLVKKQLERLQTTMAGRFSAVGDALILALKEAGKQPQRQQVFVLFTDAHESLGKVAPEAAAHLLGEANIPLYIMALGSALPPETDATGTNKGLYEPVNLSLLEAIAKPANGNVWQADSAAALEQALATLKQQQRNQAAAQPRYAQHPLYFWCLLAGLLPLLLWQSWRQWREASR